MNIYDVIDKIIEYKKTILTNVLFFLSLGLFFCVFQPKLYRASITLIPYDDAVTTSLNNIIEAQAAILNQSGKTSLGVQSSTQTRILAYLNSHELLKMVLSGLPQVEEALANEFALDIKKLSDPAVQDSLIEHFQSQWYQASRDPKRPSLIRVAVTSRDPQMSADLTNKIVDSVAVFIKRKSLGRGGKRRKFIEARVLDLQKDILNMSKEISDKSDQKQFFAEDKPSSVDDDLHFTFQGKDFKTDLLASKKMYMNYKVQTYNTLNHINQLLYEQLEWARINENEEANIFDVIDPAMPPHKAYSPNAPLVMALCSVLGLLASLLSMTVLEVARGYRRNKSVSKPI